MTLRKLQGYPKPCTLRTMRRGSRQNHRRGIGTGDPEPPAGGGRAEGPGRTEWGEYVVRYSL